MKFKDKLELFKILKKEIIINNPATNLVSATPVPLIQRSYSQLLGINHPVQEELPKPQPLNEEQVAVLEEKRKKVKTDMLERNRKCEELKKQQAVFEAGVAEQKASKSKYPPGMYEFNVPPSPAETKILIDGKLVGNIYSVEYAYIYIVDDRTLEERVNGIKEDEFHVIGCLTIQFFSPGDVETFNGKTISLINSNDLGQMFEMHIIGIHPLAEVGGVALSDTVMTKTVWFEAKDIVGRCCA